MDNAAPSWKKSLCAFIQDGVAWINPLILIKAVLDARGKIFHIGIPGLAPQPFVLKIANGLISKVFGNCHIKPWMTGIM